MRIFCFDRSAGRELNDYGSENVVFTRIARLANNAQISCMHIGPEGVVGYHQATIPQLFLVVKGSGWVRAETSERTEIKGGQAAFWDAGEWHEAGTDSDMMAIVIEVEKAKFDPAQYMLEVTTKHST